MSRRHILHEKCQNVDLGLVVELGLQKLVIPCSRYIIIYSTFSVALDDITTGTKHMYALLLLVSLWDGFQT